MGAKVSKAVATATAEALKSTSARERHGAVVLRNRKIIGLGYNDSRPLGYLRQNRIRQFCNEQSHAETAAMHNVSRADLLGSVVVVIRLSRSGELTYSRPCSTCMEAMARKGIRKCYYSVDEESFGVITFPWRRRG